MSSETYTPGGSGDKAARKRKPVAPPPPETQAAAEEPELKRPQQERARRRRRGGLGMAANLKLNVSDKDPTYEYRWVQGTPERIRQLHKNDDYDFVKAGDAGHESVKDLDEDKGLGDLIERSGGKSKDGTPFNLVLMRKPKEWYEEDQKDKQSVNDAIDEAIRRGQTTDPQQGLDTSPSGGGYVPEGGISIRTEKGGGVEA